MERDLAAVLVEARTAAGLSQAELARRAAISPSYLSRIEGAAWARGGPWPSDGVLRALARVLGLSSTRLVALKRGAQARHAPAAPAPEGGPARRTGPLPYAVSVGHDDVDRAAREVIGQNPSGGTLRSVQAAGGGEPPSYGDALVSAAASDPGAIVYRVCASPGPAPGNVRTRVIAANPLVLDVVIGDRQVLLAVPDRRGRGSLRAGVVVDDPDFVAAVAGWFDEAVWDLPRHDETGPRRLSAARAWTGAGDGSRRPVRGGAAEGAHPPAAPRH